MLHALHPVIARYLARQMSPAEKLDFETQMAADPELAAEVVFYETLRHQHDQNLLGQWRSLGQDLLDSADSGAEIHPAGLTVSHRRSTYRWAAAATLALALTAAGFWWYNSQPSFGEKFYTRHYTTLEESTGTLSADAEQNAWSTAYRSYRQKQYDRARLEAAPLLGRDNEADRAHLLIGLCWLESGHATEARQELTQVRPVAVAWYWQARFGLAYAFLRSNEPGEATKVLDDISQHADTPDARKRAEDLLRALGK